MKRLFITARNVIGLCCMLSPGAYASPIVSQTYAGAFPATITGTLPNQNTALDEAFTLTSPGNLTITSTSYANGGFEPNLLLFNGLGNFVAGGVPFGLVDPNTGIVGDMRLTALNLPSGVYTLAVTDFLLNQSLTATKLSDGFTVNFGSGTTFTDTNGNIRTGSYSVTISPTATPEPATVWLAGPLLAGLLILSKRSVFRRLLSVHHRSFQF